MTAEPGDLAAARGTPPVEEPLEVPYENEALIGGPPSALESFEGVAGGPVLEHVQRFADALCSTAGACTISTYEGHHPDRSRALDILVSSAYGAMPDDFRLGDDVANFTLNEGTSFGVWYVIWRQEINSLDGRGWRAMADRGSITQNHFDHCHVSFEEGPSLPVLREGDQGAAVARLQQLLHQHGFNIDVDGIFGSQTTGAVLEFQASRGLDQDGVVGPMTWAALSA